MKKREYFLFSLYIFWKLELEAYNINYTDMTWPLGKGCDLWIKKERIRIVTYQKVTQFAPLLTWPMQVVPTTNVVKWTPKWHRGQIIKMMLFIQTLGIKNYQGSIRHPLINFLSSFSFDWTIKCKTYLFLQGQ